MRNEGFSISKIPTTFMSYIIKKKSIFVSVYMHLIGETFSPANSLIFLPCRASNEYDQKKLMKL